MHLDNLVGRKDKFVEPTRSKNQFEFLIITLTGTKNVSVNQKANPKKNEKRILTRVANDNNNSNKNNKNNNDNKTRVTNQFEFPILAWSKRRWRQQCSLLRIRLDQIGSSQNTTENSHRNIT